MSSAFAAAASSRLLVLDGAMGTSIYSRPLTVEHDYCGCENCTDILVQTRPDVIQEIHESFLEAGADAIETDSFGASEHVLAEFDLQDRCRKLNTMAAEVARAACDRHSTKSKPRFVLGSMGPGTKLITLGNITWDDMLASYKLQALGLLDGGIDAFMIETAQDILQVKCCLNAVLAALAEKGKSAQDVPIMISVTIESTGAMLLGTSIEAAASALANYPILSLGLNCATGPAEMAEHIGWLGKNWGLAGSATAGKLISVVPNAGLPMLIEGRTEYPLQPEPFVEAMSRFIEKSRVGIVGGCCGTTPEHIRQLASRVDALQGQYGGAHTAGGARTNAMTVLLGEVVPAAAAREGTVTSLYAAVPYRQDNSLLIIGERMNASGSRKFKQLLEAEDFDGIVSLAREQVRHESAHVLDINVDYAGRDNARDMAEVVKRVVRQVDAPLMLDSTQIKTLEAGLKHAPGKCIINSANFEDGDHKFDEMCLLAKQYNAGLVIGAIDEDKEASMARTAERKLAISQRAYDRATTVHGMQPEDLLFDPLVLPVSTGMETDRRSALETIEGVRAISRAMPAAQTTCGLSNVSFGLKPQARVVLNSVFLHELREAGLTSAILHFSKILPRNKIDDAQWQSALEVIYDRRAETSGDPLQRFIGLFADAGAAEAASAKASARATETIEQRLRSHIIDGEKEALDATLATALATYTPLAIINDHLLDGMKTVGDLFGSGQMQLPFVLQSAEVMKLAVSKLEPLMEKKAGTSKGSIVLATVKGDVHDIGKNLVDIILSNNGYTVHNIGIKQPIASIVEAFKKTKADAIGLSGLLVKSVTVMEENLRELNALAIDVPVVLGGAALARHYCEGHLRSVYEGRVYYGKDAFEGLRVMDHLVTGKHAVLDDEIAERSAKRAAAEAVVAKHQHVRDAVAIQTPATAAGIAVMDRAPALAGAGGGSGDELATGDSMPTGSSEPETTPRLARSRISEVPVPTVPFFGTRAVQNIAPEQVYPFINKIALYRGQWQVKKGATTDEAYEHLVADEMDPIFARLSAQCSRERIVQPQVVYGYFPAQSEGNDLVVYQPEPWNAGRELVEAERFSFPRQRSGKQLCISDFFRPVGGEVDVVAMHCVTVGHKASEEAHKLFAANSYAEYLFLHGFCVETAEALAELWHKRIRQEMGIGNDDAPNVRALFTQKYRGSRYSFGYPACPDMADQDKLFRLLKPERIGCVLTENWQIVPEQSTSAIIVHHPDAKYFAVSASAPPLSAASE